MCNKSTINPFMIFYRNTNKLLKKLPKDIVRLKL